MRSRGLRGPAALAVPNVSTYRVIGFPNPVNEKAARVVAAGVLLMSIATLVLSFVAGDGWLWLTVVIWLGFVARVISGPKLSVLGRLATQAVAPRLGPSRPVAGSPKRFAQGIGVAVTSVALVALILGHQGVAQILLGLLVVAAGLEAILGFCIGCRIFAGLMRLGLIPADICESCNSIALAHPGTKRSSAA